MSASNTSREHSITTGATGLITISGGKLTSNRVMATHLVNAAVAAMGGTRSRRSLAATTPISGGSGTTSARSVAAAAAVPTHLSDLWLRRYGSNAARIVKLWSEDEANREVIGPRDLTRAEIVHAVREEMTMSLEDLLVRRTSIFFWDAEGGISSINRIAMEMAALLGWSDERRTSEIAEYRTLVQVHRPR